MRSGLGFRGSAGLAKGCCVLAGWNYYHLINIETEVQSSSMLCLRQVHGLFPKEAQAS